MENFKLKTYRGINIATWTIGHFANAPKRYMPYVVGPVVTFQQFYQAKRFIDIYLKNESTILAKMEEEERRLTETVEGE